MTEVLPEGFERLGRRRSRQQEAPETVAALPGQESSLGLGLDPLRDGPQAELLGHSQYGSNDGRLVCVVRDIADEGTVDRQGIGGKVSDGRKGRVTGTEVIDRDLYTMFACP